MIMKHWLPIILLFLGAVSGVAQEEKDYSVPVEWQKVELQKDMEDRLSKTIGRVVEEGKYLVFVDLRLAEQKKFEMSAKQGEGQNFPLAKLGINKNSQAYKNALTVSGLNIFSQLAKVTVNLTIDQKVPRDRETQIRRLVQNVIRSYSNSRFELKLERMNFLDDKDQKKAQDLEVARVNVEAAKALGEAITQSNQKLAEAIAATQGVKLPEEKAEKVEEKKEVLPSDWKELLVLFKIPIGLLIATFLLAAFISGFKSIESQKVALMAQANSQAAAAQQASSSGNEDVADETPQAEVSEGGPAVGAGGEGGKSGFEQFQELSVNFAETAAFLVKTWLNMDTKESREAIAALPKKVPVEVLVPVFATLDDELKSKLKKATAMPLDASALARADSFVIEQMVENFLTNTVKLPEELKSLLSSMTMKEIKQCIERDSQLGTVFVNVLQTSQLGRLLSDLEEDQVNQLFEMGLSYSPESLNQFQQSLPQILQELRQERPQNRVPLLDKAGELIQVMGPEKENQVFAMLVSSGAKEQLLEAANRYFPAELIMQFPADRLRALLGRLGTKARATLIFSRPDEEKSILLAAIGESGRLRQIIDTEIAEIEQNERLKLQIEKDREKIWQEFVEKARSTIRTNSGIKQVADELLESWLQERGVEAQGEEYDQSA